MHNTIYAYINAPTLLGWAVNNPPKPEMIYRDGFHHQVAWMSELSRFAANAIDNLEPRVIQTHRSKSIVLPVPAILLGDPNGEWAIVMLRDNFHDINVAVVSNVPLIIDPSLVFTEMSRETYQAEKKRAYDYMGTTRVTEAQWEDGSWYGEWSAGSLVLKDNKIWVARRAFAEGISSVPGASTKPYSKGCTGFAMSFCDEHEATLARIGNLADAVRANLNP
jgi:hypothetical protein